MAQIIPCYQTVAPLLASVNVGFAVVLEDNRVDEDEIPQLFEMWKENRLAYTAAEVVERACLRVVKTMRMGDAVDGDKRLRQRERELAELIANTLTWVQNQNAPTRLYRGEAQYEPRTCEGCGLLIPKVYHNPGLLTRKAG